MLADVFEYRDFFIFCKSCVIAEVRCVAYTVSREAGVSFRYFFCFFMMIPDWKLEEKYWAEGAHFVAGIDEAGRGPLCGPVVACAAVRRRGVSIEEKFDRLIRDSKTLSEKQREAVFLVIQNAFFVGVGEIGPETIDRVNILEATFLAMKKAITALKRSLDTDVSKEIFVILTDGDKQIPNLSAVQEAVPQGDGKVKSIAAASIVAKVTRDRIMMRYHELYPQYGFDKHKGYGTRVHLDALRIYGPTSIHRFSFAPVRDASENKTVNRELQTIAQGMV